MTFLFYFEMNIDNTRNLETSTNLRKLPFCLVDPVARNLLNFCKYLNTKILQGSLWLSIRTYLTSNIFPNIPIRFVLSAISTILSKCLNKKIPLKKSRYNNQHERSRVTVNKKTRSEISRQCRHQFRHHVSGSFFLEILPNQIAATSDKR